MAPRRATAMLLVFFGLCGCDRPTSVPPAGSARPEERVVVTPRVSFVLEDGEESHRRYPETFEIPSESMRRNLREGQLVKLMFTIRAGEFTQTERMWVIVKGREEGHYLGVLDNDPQCTDELKPGHVVFFEPRHVIMIALSGKTKRPLNVEDLAPKGGED